jgi:hypothetical protein
VILKVSVHACNVYLRRGIIFFKKKKRRTFAMEKLLKFGEKDTTNKMS